jgi:LemA protein
VKHPERLRCAATTFFKENDLNWWIGGGLLAALFVLAVLTFNRLVQLSKRADGAWSDIDVQLKRRWDLIPALVETVKGYARHESSTLQDVVQARTVATQAADVAERGTHERTLSTAVSRLFALAEAYPDLKANESFQSLHRSLIEIEDSVQSARRYYNAVIRDLNTQIQRFPSVLIARATGFHERPFFQIEDDQRSVPKVNLREPAG